MENIEKLALDFLQKGTLSDDLVKEAVGGEPRRRKRKSRNTLEKNYKNIRQRYLLAKDEVEAIATQNQKLKIAYERAMKKMESYYEDMLKMRNHLSKMDDDGLEFMDLSEDETPEGFVDEEELVENNQEFDPYRSFK